MNGFGWYVIQAQPRKETFVRDRIGDLGRERFLPLMVERKPGRRRASVGPMFPGYLFARLSETQGDLPKVRWMQGVSRILGHGARPRPLDDDVVDAIRVRTGRGGTMRPGMGLERGCRVRISHGPLAGLIGILEEPASSPTERVCLLLDLFQRSTRVEVPVAAVRSRRGLR